MGPAQDGCSLVVTRGWGCFPIHWGAGLTASDRNLDPPPSAGTVGALQLGLEWRSHCNVNTRISVSMPAFLGLTTENTGFSTFSGTFLNSGQ